MSNYNYQGEPTYVNQQYQPFYQSVAYNNSDHLNYYNGQYNAYPQPGSSRSSGVAPDVLNSTLTPTAQEFTPRYEVGAATGAVRKKPGNEKPKYRDTKKSYNNSGGYRKNYYNSARDGAREPPRPKFNYDRNPDTTFRGASDKSKRHHGKHAGDGNVENSQVAEQENYNIQRDYSSKSLSSNVKNREFEDTSVNSDYGKDEETVDSRNNMPPEQLASDYSKQGRDQKNRQYRNERYNSYQNKPSKNGNYDSDKTARNNTYKNSYNKNSYRDNNYYENRYGYYKNNKNKYDKPEKDRNKYSNRNEGNGKSNENNWRLSKQENVSKLSKSLVEERQKKMDAASQRERLVDMLEARMLECLVCCEKVKNNDRVWSCKLCYHILHLSCTAAWAKSSKLENGWRCPACQNVCSEVPNQYRCYCGKVTDPKNEPGVIAHSCGDTCMRPGRTCEHRCTILCHPGPCPDCNVMVSRFCGCGATEQSVKCCSDVEIVCESVCDKLLECTLHRCKQKCHVGPCEPCDEFLEQECYCGKVGRKVPCSSEHLGAKNYTCDEVCEKMLSCGNHKCDKLCHEGPCDMCPKDVSLIKTCHCGKMKLEVDRKSCLDPVPSCNMTCGKILKCGQPSAPHICKAFCHEGECPPCPLTTLVRCRCGHMDKELPCKELTSKADDARCEKKCTKKRLCGKHRCNQRCCIEIEHVCPLPCNHLLSCGQHRCDRTCHSGRCAPCMEASFEELYCECGASVLYPPIPCGTRPPQCSNPCTRPRPCGHDANHNCHTGPCPPCTVLCKRWCYGKHEERSAIPCHQENFSCGFPCGKPMPCGRHRCTKPCHLGACPLPCRQPCTIERPLCGHPCNAPCHSPPCPESSCKQQVPVTCQCGLLRSTRPCTELADEYRSLEMAQLKEKMVDRDQAIDISDIFNKPKKPAVLKILECNEECKVTERNKRLAIGLQIRNPDLTQKLTPRYSDLMRSWAKKDTHFCQRVHSKLAELVQLAKTSKQKSRSFSFESMNRDKRHFVHEYCEHFGCESEAYDKEPNRNVVATAFKDKSWLPSMSLLEVIQRENGHRKVPGPIMTKGTPTKSESVTLKLPTRSHRPASPPGEYVDYFDDPV